ncbi:MltR family transcriptional regulator [Gracilibacillus sp. D59]|uniref:MltR family transcriptional regulator n=1 Tax=Gracilibacillus sp. D59 TaxID=3457434 RepID=UPI003FCDB39E
MNEMETEYVQAQLIKYSNERMEFLRKTEHEEILMVILRVHMYVEKELIEITNFFFKYHDKLNNYRFISRLNLLYALGVIEKELYDPISRLNQLRNDISHQLEYKFSEKEYQKLYQSLSGKILFEFKKILKEKDRELDYISKTKELLSTIWTDVKASALTSCFTMERLGSDYIVKASEEIEKFLK